MRNRMDLRGRLPYLASAYRLLSRAGKSRQLDELERLTGYARKYLISLLGERRPRPPAGVRRRRRRPRYSEEAIRVLGEIWERSGRLSAERLKEQLPLLLPHASKHVAGCTERVVGELSRISARQISRRLAPYRNARRRRANSATQRSRLLRHLIPVSTRRDSGEPPGLLENDTVAHCGGSLSGSFLRTLNSVDVATGWVCAVPVASLRTEHVLPAMRAIVRRMPFPVRALHSDNGLEFINREMWEFCARRGLRLTRGRPNHKDDNARIEQKNWTCVRQVVGYSRHESPAELRQLRRIYGCLECVANLFEPSARLVEKSRDQAKVKRRYDRPLTPLDRLVEHYRSLGEPLPARAAAWLRRRHALDPFELYARLRREVARLHDMARQTAPAAARP